MSHLQRLGNPQLQTWGEDSYIELLFDVKTAEGFALPGISQVVALRIGETELGRGDTHFKLISFLSVVILHLYNVKTNTY